MHRHLRQHKLSTGNNRKIFRVSAYEIPKASDVGIIGHGVNRKSLVIATASPI
jgi:hypothetical protein